MTRPTSPAPLERAGSAHERDHDHDHGGGGVVIHFLIGVVAILVVRLAVSGGFASFVRVGMRWPLIGSAVILAIVVVADLGLCRGGGAPPSHLRPGVYLIAPVLFAVAVAPQPLGSYAAERSNVIPSPTSPFPSIDDTAAPSELTLLEFNQRAMDRDGETLRGVTVRLTGFVMAGGDLRIARFRLACCAADGQAALVQLDNATDRPAADRWVTVEGRFDRINEDVPVLVVDRIQPIAQPADPYEPT